MNAPRTVIAAALLAGLCLGSPARAQIERLEVEPRLPTTEDRVTILVEGVVDCPAFDVRIEGERILLDAIGICDPPVPRPFRERIDVGLLPAGAYLVESTGYPAPPHGFTVEEPRTVARLLDHFDVSLRFRNPYDGSTELRPARAVQLTGESAYFWFFDPGNAEVTVKLVDGGAVNDSIWVFAASTTTVEFELLVEDRRIACLLPPCGKVYVNPPFVNRNVIDLGAFPASAE